MTSTLRAHDEFLRGYCTGTSAIDAMGLRVAGYFSGPPRTAAARALGAPAA